MDKLKKKQKQKQLHQEAYKLLFKNLSMWLYSS